MFSSESSLDSLFPISLASCACYALFTFILWQHQKKSRNLLSSNPLKSNEEKRHTLLKTFGHYSNYLFFAAVCVWYFISHAGFGLTSAMKRLILVIGFGIPFCYGLYMPLALTFLSVMAIWFTVFKDSEFLLRINSLPILGLSRSGMTKTFPACFLAALLFFVVGAVVPPGDTERFVSISAFLCGTSILFVTCFCLWNHVLNAEYGVTISRSGVSFGVSSMFSWKQVHSYTLEEQSDCFYLAIVYGEESLFSQRRRFKVAIPFEFRDDLQNALDRCFARQS